MHLVGLAALDMVQPGLSLMEQAWACHLQIGWLSITVPIAFAIVLMLDLLYTLRFAVPGCLTVDRPWLSPCG